MNHQEQPDQRFDRINPRAIRTPETLEEAEAALALAHVEWVRKWIPTVRWP